MYGIQLANENKAFHLMQHIPVKRVYLLHSSLISLFSLQREFKIMCFFNLCYFKHQFSIRPFLLVAVSSLTRKSQKTGIFGSLELYTIQILVLHLLYSSVDCSFFYLWLLSCLLMLETIQLKSSMLLLAHTKAVISRRHV